ncbi:unnamed protein product [Staurois parvus]|uniref:Uncharacterized protein n=1 Tax=Staurois parvus TaxID=386267 RepID=A0ABN9B301_9NEOB|nr:unnamed protein product [Staurois parvus]
MYINGRTGALPMRVDISKCPPASIACACSLGARHTAIGARCVLRTQQNTDRCMGPLCQVPIHVILDWPISDRMQSNKQDVTSDIIAYYV